ncbi:hypothetical protein HMPREF9057_00028 [Actinomyces sp. oral taxon 171 str. F0337]|nr:hypothetical protein HMPREF9057_00028 [Actinomyces sp. oral taxon 171 str. F0337]
MVTSLCVGDKKLPPCRCVHDASGSCAEGSVAAGGGFLSAVESEGDYS